MMSRHRHARATVLLVGEGVTEMAFLKHLKSLYVSRGCGLSATIKSAGGRGPKHIVTYATRLSHYIDFDRKLVLLDTDVRIENTVREQARLSGIQLVESSPCIEGLLLEILGRKVPIRSDECKRECKKIFSGALTEQGSYQKVLTLALLNERRNCVRALTELIDGFSVDGNA